MAARSLNDDPEVFRAVCALSDALGSHGLTLAEVRVSGALRPTELVESPAGKVAVVHSLERFESPTYGEPLLTDAEVAHVQQWLGRRT